MTLSLFDALIRPDIVVNLLLSHCSNWAEDGSVQYRTVVLYLIFKLFYEPNLFEVSFRPDKPLT